MPKNGQTSLFDEINRGAQAVLLESLSPEIFSHGRQIKSLFARQEETRGGMEVHRNWLFELARTVKSQGEIIDAHERELTALRSEVAALKVLTVSKVKRGS